MGIELLIIAFVLGLIIGNLPNIKRGLKNGK